MRFYKFALYKAYFDKGFGVTSYIKYILAFVSLATLNARLMIIIGIIYGISCFIVGYYWYKLKIVDAENEVQNNFNPFVKEIREKVTGAEFYKEPKSI